MHVRGVILAALALAGCSSNITVAKLDPSGPPPTGVPWNLAMTQYTLTITRQVISCDTTMNAKVSVAVTQGKALDPNMRYVLSSDGFWATSDITSGLNADGTSLSLNGHSEDQTATVITNVITTAAQIATAGGAGGGDGAVFQCTPAVETARINLDPTQSKDPKVRKGPSLAAIVDTDNNDVTAATALVTQLTSAVQTDPSKKKALSQASKDLSDKKDKLTKDQATLTANLKVVQDVQTVVWPPSGDVVKSDSLFTLDETVAQKWVHWVVYSGGQPTSVASKPFPAGSMKKFDVSLALYRPVYGVTGVESWTTKPPSSTTPDIKVGVPVRVAGIGRLMVCTGVTPCSDMVTPNQHLTATEALPIKPDAPVLQLGQMYVVPITGGTFKSELAAINLDANGNPTSIEIAEKTAVAAAATGALSSGLTQIAAIPGQVAAAKLTRTQGETAQINAQNALTQAQANAKLAGVTSTTVAQGAYATAQANLATAQATAQSAGPAGQLALVTAQNNLAVAQAQAAQIVGLPEDPGALAALNTQTTLLTAQANEINAEAALAKARAALGSP